jgi:hypothetical protein
MRAGWARAAVVAAAALWGAACVDSEVMPIGARRPSRPEGCPVAMFPAMQPPYPFAQVASARAKCHFSMGRNACIDELRKQACAAGADTIFGFAEGMKGEFTFISATLAARMAEAPAPVAQPWSPAIGEASCNPVCSPGFACRAGECIPQCNPPCEAAEICSRKRVCEPAQGKLGPAKASGTSL